MVKFSKGYCKRFWSYHCFIQIYSIPMTTLCPLDVQSGHRVVICMVLIWIKNDRSKTVYNILLKFSLYVNHKSVTKWWKNFGRSTTDMSATPLFVSKLWEGLATIFIELHLQKKVGEVLDPYQLPNGRKLKYL